MGNSRTLETAVGAFVLIGMLALVALAMKVSNLSELGVGDSGYQIIVKFDNIGGLKVRSPVKMAGVQIGRVGAIGIDNATYKAKTTLNIDTQYNNLPTDTSAKIFTAGLLGEQYVSLEAGGEETMLQDGSEITLVSNAVVLEQVISQFLYNKAAGN